MALIDIKTPDESSEGTTMKVQVWLKKIGDKVIKDEPLVEMETDKVTLEIEAPSDGVLKEILIEPGVDVLPGMIIGRIDTDDSDQPQDKSKTNKNDVKLAAKTHQPNKKKSANAFTNKALSPLVKRFVKDNDINVELVQGSGRDGRVTFKDVKDYIAGGKNPQSSKLQPSALKNPKISPQSNLISKHVPHSAMRRSIAKHMSHSTMTAPHVTAVFELDFSAIYAHREANKAEFAAQGVKLTYTAYFLQACVGAMQVVPQVNSQWHEDSIEIFSEINIGVGTALGDKGLIVPVIKSVQEKNLFGIAKCLQEKTARARDNKLKPDDVRGGTFTISNHGVSGSLVATPIIINQPQSAILGIGKLEKRVIVQSIKGQDVIAIKPMAFVSLTIDHRVLDGHQTNSWLATFVSILENWEL